MAPTALVVCGHVTRDLIAGEERLGGAATFAARAAGHLGVETALFSAAAPESHLLAALNDTPHLAVELLPSRHTTTFELTYLPEGRRLRLLARAETLDAGALPSRLRAAAVAYVAPVAGECDAGFIAALGAGFTGIGLQGFLRTTAADGRVLPRLPADLAEQLQAAQACIFSVEDHPEAERIAQLLADRGLVVALTRAARGVTLYHGGGREDVPAAPATEVDPTGAGDVFGMVFSVAMSRGATPRRAAELAALAAARVVEGPGLGRLGSLVSDWRW